MSEGEVKYNVKVKRGVSWSERDLVIDRESVKYFHKGNLRFDMKISDIVLEEDFDNKIVVIMSKTDSKVHVKVYNDDINVIKEIVKMINENQKSEESVIDTSKKEEEKKEENSEQSQFDYINDTIEKLKWVMIATTKKSIVYLNTNDDDSITKSIELLSSIDNRVTNSFNNIKSIQEYIASSYQSMRSQYQNILIVSILIISLSMSYLLSDYPITLMTLIIAIVSSLYVLASYSNTKIDIDINVTRQVDSSSNINSYMKVSSIYHNESISSLSSSMTKIENEKIKSKVITVNENKIYVVYTVESMIYRIDEYRSKLNDIKKTSFIALSLFISNILPMNILTDTISQI